MGGMGRSGDLFSGVSRDETRSIIGSQTRINRTNSKANARNVNKPAGNSEYRRPKNGFALSGEVLIERLRNLPAGPGNFQSSLRDLSSLEPDLSKLAFKTLRFGNYSLWNRCPFLVIPPAPACRGSVPGFPASPLYPRPKPQLSTGNPGKPRDLQFRGPLLETRNTRSFMDRRKWHFASYVCAAISICHCLVLRSRTIIVRPVAYT